MNCMGWEEKIENLPRCDAFSDQGELVVEMTGDGDLVKFEDVLDFLKSLTQEDF